MKVKLISFAIVFLLISLSTWAVEKKEITAQVGFQEIYLKDSLDKTLEKINNYGFNYQIQDSKYDLQLFNPYLLLSKNFNYIYASYGLGVKLGRETYYMTFDGLSFDHVNYEVYNNKENNQFYIKYMKLKLLELTDKTHLAKLNRYLTQLSFYFFSEKLYKIKYALELDMDELNRLISNLNGRFGKFTHLRLKDLDKQTKKIIWGYKDINLTMTLNVNTFKNLAQIDEIRTNSEQFSRQAIGIEVLCNPIDKQRQRYQKEIDSELLDSLKHELEIQMQDLKKAVSTGKKEYLEQHKINEHQHYNEIDKIY